MFTKKHFIGIAAAVSKVSNKTERKKLADFHAKNFAADNPRFNKEKFLAACGVK
jgi:hypothetical protein